MAFARLLRRNEGVVVLFFRLSSNCQSHLKEETSVELELKRGSPW